jgi:hypothetical protein
VRSVSLENHLQRTEFPTTVWLLHDQISDHRERAARTWISAISKLLLPLTLLHVRIAMTRSPPQSSSQSD